VIPYPPGAEDWAPDGAAALDAARTVLVRYCVLPFPEAADAVVLWCAATHALPSLPAAPRLAITSPVKRAGKTRLLDVIEGIAYKPLPTMNSTTAAVFRSLDVAHPPTLLFDEVDTIFGSARVAENNEDLRGLLNAGFQRGKAALRCHGPSQKPTLFATFRDDRAGGDRWPAGHHHRPGCEHPDASSQDRRDGPALPGAPRRARPEVRARPAGSVVG